MDQDEKMIQAQQMPVLTIESNGSYVTAADAKEQAWYELQNAYRSRRILSGVLGGRYRGKWRKYRSGSIL